MKLVESRLLSNAEVRSFLRDKREKHDLEDMRDRTAGKTSVPRPTNLIRSLEKHERHLNSDSYSYETNPNSYDGEQANKSLRQFSDEIMKQIQEPLYQRYVEAVRNGSTTTKQAKDKLAAEQEKKELSVAEMLMIQNHAPQVVELLQPMIENVEERFTMEELDAVVDCVKAAYRRDEAKT